jgi:uncharacterized membrane protein YgdD (TMEM256/DUF423 family)
MSEILFALGCISMCSSLGAMTYGYHGGLTYEQKKHWKKAVNFQQLGALPLLLSKSCRSTLPGYLAIIGTATFSIPLYYSSITDDKTYNKVMPYGGVLMMASWVALALLQ